MLPFTRNVFDPMDFTPMNLSGIPNIERRTTNGFELATSIVFYSGIQHLAETAKGIHKVPDYVVDFLQELPCGSWDETKFVDGFPGKLAVIARRKGNHWYIGGINGENESKDLTLKLSFLPNGTSGIIIADGSGDKFSFSEQAVELDNPDEVPVSLKPFGGFVMKFD
jgi:hypothetical protein